MVLLAALFFLSAALEPDHAYEIGLRVWQNECSGSVEGLASWNEGEEFASLGIGHFIWYPVNKRGPYAETFPELVQFMKSRGADIPRWLEESHGCPWKNREAFLRAKRGNTKQIAELRRLLKDTLSLQVQYLHSRLNAALPTLLAHAPEDQKAKIQARYDRIFAHPNGPYVLLDYVNFKGYGTSADERYAGWGWGLFQVLDTMSDDLKRDPVQEFVRAAKALLEQRIKNAPAQKNEQRYLQGWFHRLDSYYHN
jgi:hypothetical protein